MWANKPEMAREWTEEYGSKVKAKTGTMAKTDDKWIQKATKNMRKDKPCTGDKFGGPTCPKGSRRYNLAKTFKKMNKPKKASLGKMFRKSSTATPTSGSSSGGGSSGMGGLLRRLFEEKKHLFGKAGGGPIKAKHGEFVPVANPHVDVAKYVDRITGIEQEPERGRSRIKDSEEKVIKKKKSAGKGLGKKKPKILIINPEQGIKLWNKETGWNGSKAPKVEDKVTKWDQVKGGQRFTPGWKPQLSVRTAKEGKIIKAKKGLWSGAATSLYDKPPGWEASKISDKTHKKLTKLWKHREAGGWKKAKGYKKHLKALKKMQTTPLSGMSKTLPPKTARLLGQLKFAYKDKSKARALSAAKTLPRHVKFLGTAGKVAAVGYGLAAAYQAGKRNLLSKENLQKPIFKKKVQKKSTGGEIIIGRGVDLDLL